MKCHCVGLSRALGVALCLCLFSCGEDPAKSPGMTLRDPLMQYPRMVGLEGLDEFLGWEQPIESHDGVLRVTAPVRAMTDHEELNVQYRFFFFDDYRRPLDNDPEWRYMLLPSRTQVFLEGNALNSKAVDWRLEVRPAR